jgi:recombination protein RecA
MGVEQGIVRKSGAWYTYEGDQLGQGKENARNFLRDNPDMANEIEKRIKEKLGVGPRIDADPGTPSHPSNGSGNGRAANGRAAAASSPSSPSTPSAPSRTAVTVPGVTV